MNKSKIRERLLKERLHPAHFCRWKAVTSSRVDTKALKAAAPELVERFTKTTTTRRFVVA